MTRKQAAASGVAGLITLSACAASFFATTPNQLAACAIIAIAALTTFAIAMGDDNG